jgi:hypothetical protein
MLVNGPINVVRLEGEINDIKKIIYIFFDFHEDIRLQTKCESYESIDIDKYLYKLFKNTKETVDFFLEIKSNDIEKSKPDNFNDMYIQNIRKLYNRGIYKNEESKNNIRFHYLDIRDYLKKNIYYWERVLDNSIGNMRSRKDIFYNDYNNMIEACTALISELEIYLNYFKQKNITAKNKSEIIYFLDKITKKYNNIDIFNKINKDYIGDIVFHINETLAKLRKLKGILIDMEEYVYEIYEKKGIYDNKDDIYSIFKLYKNKKNMHKIIFNIDELGDDINFALTYIFLKITDLFFLRRFLDKDYISKAISYTGGAHSANYINLLVKYYDFKITHFSFSEETNLETLNKIAKNDIKKLNYVLTPKELIQCSDLSGFPNDF